MIDDILVQVLLFALPRPAVASDFPAEADLAWDREMGA